MKTYSYSEQRNLGAAITILATIILITGATLNIYPLAILAAAGIYLGATRTAFAHGLRDGINLNQPPHHQAQDFTLTDQNPNE